MRWTVAQYEKHSLKMGVKPVKIIKPDPIGLAHIKSILENLNIEYECEHRFDVTRKYRFDIAVKDLRLGIEYEGLCSAKSRHTTLTGYTNDTSKYNLSQCLGWRILRYTALNYLQFEQDILKIIK